MLPEGYGTAGGKLTSMKNWIKHSLTTAPVLLLLLCFMGLLLLQFTHNHFSSRTDSNGSLRVQCSICMLLNSMAVYEVSAFILLLVFLACLARLYLFTFATVSHAFFTYDSRGPPAPVNPD
jgi:hypothetical protein